MSLPNEEKEFETYPRDENGESENAPEGGSEGDSWVAFFKGTPESVGNFRAAAAEAYQRDESVESENAPESEAGSEEDFQADVDETYPQDESEAATESVRKENVRKLWIPAAAILLAVFLGYLYLAGGGESAARAQNQPQFVPPTVIVHRVGNADLAAGSEYIGKVESIQAASLRPQVAGEIAKVHFKEGSFVEAGDLLFTLDNKQYLAAVELRRADLARAEASLERASKYYDRLNAADKRSVSATDLDVAANDVLLGKAGVAQAKAALKLAQIDLENTKIAAPISGQIGKAEFTKGNYVSPSSPPLADIVQLDPIRVAFALSDIDYLRQLNALKSGDGSIYKSTLRLPDGTVYPFGGERDFEDNTMDSRTGTIVIRLRFENDRGLLVPGSMVRVAVKPIQSHVSPVIPQEAILADQEGDYVYVVGGDKIATLRRIKSGSEFGSMREVVFGLQADEDIIMQGLQSIRPNLPVNPVVPRNRAEDDSPAARARESGYDVRP